MSSRELNPKQTADRSGVKREAGLIVADKTGRRDAYMRYHLRAKAESLRSKSARGAVKRVGGAARTRFTRHWARTAHTSAAGNPFGSPTRHSRLVQHGLSNGDERRPATISLSYCGRSVDR